ncbi:MAG: hypothetical protein A2790_08330 [Phenylobacterium sp. RIFCSPHIGHO2_01_FULL_69_31]|nr:MAG: hypothetical protein A2790_08330 [Phenylobacterium sp. RIFCSPHIGHO2_01_FULL_69_31]
MSPLSPKALSRLEVLPDQTSVRLTVSAVAEVARPLHYCLLPVGGALLIPFFVFDAKGANTGTSVAMDVLFILLRLGAAGYASTTAAGSPHRLGKSSPLNQRGAVARWHVLGGVLAGSDRFTADVETRRRHEMDPIVRYVGADTRDGGGM